MSFVLAANRWREYTPAVYFFSLMVVSFVTIFSVLADTGILLVFASRAVAEV
jgi:hypothetical protein